MTWDAPKAPDGIDSERGAFFILDLNEPGGCINFIVHKGDQKALGDADSLMDLAHGNIAYTQHGSSAITYGGEEGPALITLSGSSAHWVDDSSLLYDPPADAARISLIGDPDGAIAVSDNTLTGGTSIDLTATTLGDASASKFPHIADWAAWQIPTGDLDVRTWLSGELVAAAFVLIEIAL